MRVSVVQNENRPNTDIGVFVTLRGITARLFLAVLLIALPSSCRLYSKPTPSPTAPLLQVTDWVRGEPLDVTLPRTNRIAVVLIWETWCDSCMTSLPHIVDLQTRFLERGVIIVGITPEPPDIVKSFLTNSDIGSTLNFTIGCDDNRKTFDSYMNGFGRTSIPTTFVVDDKGRIVWHGHPKAGLEDVLKQILSGKFDANKASLALKAEKLQADYFRLAATNSQASEVTKMGKKIVSDGASNPWLMNNFAWRILTDSKLKTRDLNLAFRASKAACDATGWSRPSFLDTQANVLFDQGKPADAIRAANLALSQCTNSVLRLQIEQSLRKFEAPSKQNTGN